MHENKVIAKIKKSASREVWVSLAQYKGKLRIDIREFFRVDDETKWTPSKKGVTITHEDIAEAVDAVESLVQKDSIGVVSELNRGKRGTLRFAVCEFNKHVYGDIRYYYRSDPGEDEWKPGKGVTIPLPRLSELAEALRMAEDELDQPGRR